MDFTEDLLGENEANKDAEKKEPVFCETCPAGTYASRAIELTNFE